MDNRLTRRTVYVGGVSEKEVVTAEQEWRECLCGEGPEQKLCELKWLGWSWSDRLLVRVRCDWEDDGGRFYNEPVMREEKEAVQADMGGVVHDQTEKVGSSL